LDIKRKKKKKTNFLVMGTPGFMTIKLQFEVYMLIYIPSKATSPGVSIPMEANLSRTTDMLSLWSGR
jgi:hypothetical protein